MHWIDVVGAAPSSLTVKFELDVPPAPFVAVTLFVAGSAAPEPKL